MKKPQGMPSNSWPMRNTGNELACRVSDRPRPPCLTCKERDENKASPGVSSSPTLPRTPVKSFLCPSVAPVPPPSRCEPLKRKRDLVGPLVGPLVETVGRRADDDRADSPAHLEGGGTGATEGQRSMAFPYPAPHPRLVCPRVTLVARSKGPKQGSFEVDSACRGRSAVGPSSPRSRPSSPSSPGLHGHCPCWPIDRDAESTSKLPCFGPFERVSTSGPTSGPTRSLLRFNGFSLPRSSSSSGLPPSHL
jgi:hypothetical protein